jgi:hypothetical protein
MFLLRLEYADGIDSSPGTKNIELFRGTSIIVFLSNCRSCSNMGDDFVAIVDADTQHRIQAWRVEQIRKRLADADGPVVLSDYPFELDYL